MLKVTHAHLRFCSFQLFPAVTNNTKYNTKREGAHKINKYGFGEQIHWFLVDRWPIRAKKCAVSKGIRVGVACVINYLQPTYLHL